MTTSNLAQAGFVAHLADEYLDGVLEKRPLAKPLLDACIVKLNEVSNMVIYIHPPLSIPRWGQLRLKITSTNSRIF
jgi:hypothetical protein